jgi:hypothetical protein
MTHQYKYNFDMALRSYINKYGFSITNIKYEYPRLVMPNNNVMIHYRHSKFYTGDNSKNTTQTFHYGEIPDFSFIKSDLEYLEIPIPENNNNMLKIMDEMSSLNVVYTLYNDMVAKYALGIIAKDRDFFNNYIKDHGFHYTTFCDNPFYDNHKKIFFDKIDDLKMSIFHMKFGKVDIQFVNRRIPE